MYCLSLMASVHHGSLEVLHPQITPPSAARQPPAGMAISQMSAALLSPFLLSALFRLCTMRENYSRGSHQDSTLETRVEPKKGQKGDRNDAEVAKHCPLSPWHFFNFSLGMRAGWGDYKSIAKELFFLVTLLCSSARSSPLYFPAILA